MTTIVYKNGILAADTQVTYQDNKCFGFTKKIQETKDFVFGCAGTVATCYEFKKFLEGKEFNKDIFSKDEFRSDFIVINKNTKKISFYDHNLVEESITGDYFSIGSGCQYAYGALAMGASSKKAVLIASKFDYRTNDKIDFFDLNLKLIK
jgi:ATP-dependent protease HslVU (ClpYQ) peptidase subunit